MAVIYWGGQDDPKLAKFTGPEEDSFFKGYWPTQFQPKPPLFTEINDDPQLKAFSGPEEDSQFKAYFPFQFQPRPTLFVDPQDYLVPPPAAFVPEEDSRFVAFWPKVFSPLVSTFFESGMEFVPTSGQQVIVDYIPTYRPRRRG